MEVAIICLCVALGVGLWAILNQANQISRLRDALIAKDKTIQSARLEAVSRSKAVTRGKITEEFAPLFPDFPYNMSDCKFFGSPIDFLVLKGMSDFRDGLGGEIEIIFADVKVNTAQRNKVQNAIKKAVEAKSVRFETWKIDENKKLTIK